MKKEDRLNMVVFMVALQKYAMQFGEMEILHDEFDAFLADKLNAIAIKPIKGGVVVYHDKVKKSKRK